MHLRWVDYAAEKEIIRRIRDRVFVQEQHIDPELEFDGEDAIAQHCLAELDTQAIGTLRLRPYSPQIAKLERLAVLAEFRRRGVGQLLTQSAIASAQQQGYTQMLLHAQQYIAPLYAKFGFVSVGEPFWEAHIPHIKMVLIFHP